MRIQQWIFKILRIDILILKINKRGEIIKDLFKIWKIKKVIWTNKITVKLKKINQKIDKDQKVQGLKTWKNRKINWQQSSFRPNKTI